MISADQSGFVAVWDIENGKLMSKFGDAHGPKSKITAGCFDESMRRLLTAGSNGTIKIWNFSNGQCLKDFVMKSPGGEKIIYQVDREVTNLI